MQAGRRDRRRRELGDEEYLSSRQRANDRWRTKNKERGAAGKRRRQLAIRYGPTPEQYDEMFAAQNGQCLLCGKKAKLIVDHDHETGRVRGLLCHPCNTELGAFGDDAEVLRRAADYLEVNRGTRRRRSTRPRGWNQTRRGLYLTSRTMGDLSAASRGPGPLARRLLRRSIMRRAFHIL